MARLGDICIQITDGSHNPPMGVEQSNYLMLSSKNIDDDHITFNDPRYLSQEDFEAENKRTNIKPNDLLITIVGTIGRVAIVPNSLTEFCVQRSVAVLKPKPEMVYNRFLMYYLQNMRPYLEQESRGVAQKGIYLKQLSNLSIILPPLDEQRKIAAVLDKVSDLIAKRRKQLDKLDELIKARFVEMFGDMVNNPKAWDTYSLDDCFEITSSKRILKSEWKDSGIPFLRVRDMVQLATTGKVDNEFFISEEFYASLSDSDGIPKEGDILVSATSTLGKCYVVGKGERFYFKDADVLRLRAKKEINPIFFIEQMKTGYIEEQISKTLGVTTVAHFTIKAAKIINMRCPNIELQNQFAAFVEQTEKTKTAISKSLEKLETLKKALMQEYFG